MKKKFPLVSVLINNYNKEKFCVRAVKSILKQSYDKIEIIFYDDLSNDSSLDKIKKIKNNKLKIIKNKLRGKIYSINQLNAIFKSLKKCKGEIICILDSDDFFEKNKIKEVVNFFNENQNCDILFDKPIIYNGNSHYKSLVRYRDRKNKWPIFPPTSCISIRKKALMKDERKISVKKFHEVWFDFRIATYYSLKKNQFNILEKHLTYYRNYSSSFDKKYKKFFNFIWWKRRYQAFEFINYIDKNFYYKNRFTIDYLVTWAINKLKFL